MIPTIFSTGEDPPAIESDDWVDVLEIPGDSVVHHLHLLNESDGAGWWRIMSDDGQSTPPVRLPAGVGDTGERRAAIDMRIPGLSGVRVQVKRGTMGDAIRRLHVWAHR